DLMGAQFINSFADIVTTKNFDEDAVTKIISRESANFVQECAEKFGIVAEIGEGVFDFARDHYDKKTGAYGIKNVMKNLFDALTQHQLLSDTEVKSVKVIARDGKLYFLEGEKETDVAELIKKEDPVDIESIKKELDDIVGLTRVKEYVLALKDNYDVQQMREKQGLKNVGVSRHMIFTGNPGTGKTTIARIISRYLRALGVLSGGQLVEVTRADLVGQYVGHTAPLTMKVLRSAIGGVLFIDEAYSLYRGKDDVFGLECIDTLVKGIEDYRDDLIVILAGYEKEMEVFLTANTGLKSRFPNIINFPDYTPEELVAIAHSVAKSKDYIILPECDEPLLAYFTAMQDDLLHVSGNGRTVRNKVEEAILRQSRRTLKDPDAVLNELTKEDFNLSDTSFVE
ncbi:MAG: AAA family ATPase, partial [Erysipelotrichales bacterium]|nr:AAA family ATPase [Erysipelotrichales bacterium]